MNAEQKARFFLSFIHFCQEIRYGVAKEVVVHDHTPLFCNDWHKNLRRDSSDTKPACFTLRNLPKPWLEFKEYLDIFLGQGIIHELKIQDGLPISWEQARRSRSAPNSFSSFRRGWIIKDASSLLKYAAPGTDSKE